MNMGVRFSVRLSPLMVKRLRLRALDLGVTPSEFLRDIIEKELQQRGEADALAQVNTEITLVTGMMFREFLGHTLGREEARSLEDWASGRASAIIQGTLRDRGEES